nr:MAG: hypothetical protein [Helarchaeota virus Nidhogg Meg22_1012]URC17384.1 MAG: hypothetical protein [Helarchaeota virus Nidhogg Meg22_1214]
MCPIRAPHRAKKIRAMISEFGFRIGDPELRSPLTMDLLLKNREKIQKQIAEETSETALEMLNKSLNKLNDRIKYREEMLRTVLYPKGKVPFSIQKKFPMSFWSTKGGLRNVQTVGVRRRGRKKH